MRMRHTETVVQTFKLSMKNNFRKCPLLPPSSSGEYRTSDGAKADKKRSRLKCPTYNEVLTFQARVNDLVLGH